MSAFTFNNKYTFDISEEPMIKEALSKPSTIDYNLTPSESEIIEATKVAFNKDKKYLKFLNKVLDNWGSLDIKDTKLKKFAENIDKSAARQSVSDILNKKYNLIFCENAVMKIVDKTLVGLIMDYSKKYLIEYYMSERYF